MSGYCGRKGAVRHFAADALPGCNGHRRQKGYAIPSPPPAGWEGSPNTGRVRRRVSPSGGVSARSTTINTRGVPFDSQGSTPPTGDGSTAPHGRCPQSKSQITAFRPLGIRVPAHPSLRRHVHAGRYESTAQFWHAALERVAKRGTEVHCPMGQWSNVRSRGHPEHKGGSESYPLGSSTFASCTASGERCPRQESRPGRGLRYEVRR